MLEEREIMTEELEVVKEVDNSINNEKGYAFAYNITIVSAVATVAMFVIGTALYLTIVG